MKEQRRVNMLFVAFRRKSRHDSSSLVFHDSLSYVKSFSLYLPAPGPISRAAIPTQCILLEQALREKGQFRFGRRSLP